MELEIRNFLDSQCLIPVKSKRVRTKICIYMLMFMFIRINKDQYLSFHLSSLQVCEERPVHWPEFEFPRRPCRSDRINSDFTDLTFDYGEEGKKFDSEGEYEIL